MINQKIFVKWERKWYIFHDKRGGERCECSIHLFRLLRLLQDVHLVYKFVK